MPNPVVTAEARRGVEVERLRKQVASIQREIDAGINGINGCPVPYPVERRELLKAERDRLDAEMTALDALTPDELVARFNPPPPDAEPVRLEDLFGRGAYTPRQEVVHRETLPDRRTGGNPVPVQPSAAAPGRVYTYKDGQLVAL
jgi:hypothetical protein